LEFGLASLSGGCHDTGIGISSDTNKQKATALKDQVSTKEEADKAVLDGSQETKMDFGYF
jgi:hypothetical protein